VSDPSAPPPPEPPLDAEVVADRPPEAVPPSRADRSREVASTFAVGFAMGTADIVPGFSGGTVALVAGIYQRLVANVRQGARTLSLWGRGRVRDGWQAFTAIEWPFVVALLGGVGVALVTLASLLSTLLAEQPVAMSALFLGLIVGAAVVAVAELRAPSVQHLGIVVVVAVVAAVGLGFSAGTVTDPSPLLLFGAATVAICAMILPGVSGSFLLLLFGVYDPVVDAVADLDLAVIAVVGLGAVTGLAAFSTVLNWALREHHDRVLAGLIGLMVGSARVLWPWPSASGVGDPQLGAPVGADVPLALGLAIGGALVVTVVATVARRTVRVG
jgi:putative membrane protein